MSGAASSASGSSATVPASSSAASSKRWYFSQEKLSNTPSVLAGYTLEKELSYRQQAANFIQDMGQRLKVTQLCINTAIVYMQRFYMFHSFSRFHRNTIATASLFLAAKVEEQPRKLEHVIKVAHICLHRDQPQLDPRSDVYQEQAHELVTNENILLQTLGFDVAIDHPHTHVVKCCQLVRASKELAQTSYFMATNSLHLTTMCLRYSPTIVACVCIHLACKWSNYKIPLSAQKKEWFLYVDSSVTVRLLETLTEEFLTIFEQCPSRLKKKIMASTQATKDEEERREHADVPAAHYQPDLSVHPETGGSGNVSGKHILQHLGSHRSHHAHQHKSATGKAVPTTGGHANPHHPGSKPSVHPGIPSSSHPDYQARGNSASAQQHKHGDHRRHQGGHRNSMPMASSSQPQQQAQNPAKRPAPGNTSAMDAQRKQKPPVPEMGHANSSRDLQLKQQQRPQQHPQLPHHQQKISQSQLQQQHQKRGQAMPAHGSAQQQNASKPHQRPVQQGGASVPEVRHQQGAPMNWPQQHKSSSAVQSQPHHKRPSSSHHPDKRRSAPAQPPAHSSNNPLAGQFGSSSQQQLPPPPPQQKKRSIFDIDSPPPTNKFLPAFASSDGSGTGEMVEESKTAPSAPLQRRLFPQASAQPSNLKREPSPAMKEDGSQPKAAEDPKHHLNHVKNRSGESETNSRNSSPVKKSKLKLPATPGSQPSLQGSLFSPPGSSDLSVSTALESRKRTTSNCSNSSGRGHDSPSVKIPKLEELTGYETFKDAQRTSIKLDPSKDADAQKGSPLKQMLVSIPVATTTTDVVNSVAQSSSSSGVVDSRHRKSEKKHKKEKKKKEKKEKREKHHHGDEATRHHKSKHKDKERRSHSSAHHGHSSKHHPSQAHHKASPLSSINVGSGNEEPVIPKLKIKLGGNGHQAVAAAGSDLDEGGEKVAPLKITIGSGSSSSSDPTKKQRTKENGAIDNGPASKMSRVLGTALESESAFFAENSAKMKKE